MSTATTTANLGSNLPNNLAMNVLGGVNITAPKLQAALETSLNNMSNAIAQIQNSELELSILIAALVRRARTDRAAVLQAIERDDARWKALTRNDGVEVKVKDVLHGHKFAKIDEKSASSKSRIKLHAEFLAEFYRNDEAAYFDKLATLHTMLDLRRLRDQTDPAQPRAQPARDARIQLLTGMLTGKGTVARDDGTAPGEGQVGIAIVVGGKEGVLNTYGFLNPDCFGKDAEARARYLSTMQATLKAMLVGRGFDEKLIERKLGKAKAETV